MNRKKELSPPKEPIIEYVFVTEENDSVDIIFDELFEHIEKEIRKRI